MGPPLYHSLFYSNCMTLFFKFKLYSKKYLIAAELICRHKVTVNYKTFMPKDQDVTQLRRDPLKNAKSTNKYSIGTGYTHSLFMS